MNFVYRYLSYSFTELNSARGQLLIMDKYGYYFFFVWGKKKKPKKKLKEENLMG
eukprot:GAHX01005929.1.p1 GENE.GAHX01005929.1~~GAHX01005929.1.p1  ORF type:complete len:54 (+),score=1.71 GAHX01005929.1:66-227(+)